MAKKTVKVPQTTGDDTPTADTTATLAEEVGAGGGAGSVGGGDPGETAAEIPAAIDEGVKPAAEPVAAEPAKGPTADSFDEPLRIAREKLAALKADLAAAPDPAAETLRLGKVYQELYEKAQAKKRAIDEEVEAALAAVRAEQGNQGKKADAKNALVTFVARAERDVAVLEEQQRIAALKK